MEEVTILGVGSKPSRVSVQGQVSSEFQFFEPQQKLVIANTNLDLNDLVTLVWAQ